MIPDSKASPKNAGLIPAKDRYDQGKSLQEKVPFNSHADWSVDDQRANPVDLIEEQNEDRISWLVPVRRSRMSASTFAFYRGSARIMHTTCQKPRYLEYRLKYVEMHTWQILEYTLHLKGSLFLI